MVSILSRRCSRISLLMSISYRHDDKSSSRTLERPAGSRLKRLSPRARTSSRVRLLEYRLIGRVRSLPPRGETTSLRALPPGSRSVACLPSMTPPRSPSSPPLVPKAASAAPAHPPNKRNQRGYAVAHPDLCRASRSKYAGPPSFARSPVWPDRLTSDLD